MEPHVLSEDRASRKHGAEGRYVLAHAETVARSLLQPHDARHRSTFVSVAMRLSAPWRPIHPDPALSQTKHRVVVVQQPRAFDVLQPKARMGALSRAALSHEEKALAVIHHDGSMDGHGSVRKYRLGEHDAQHRTQGRLRKAVVPTDEGPHIGDSLIELHHMGQTVVVVKLYAVAGRRAIQEGMTHIVAVLIQKHISLPCGK